MSTPSLFSSPPDPNESDAVPAHGTPPALGVPPASGQPAGYPGYSTSGYPGYGPYAPPPPRTNTWAIVSLVCSLAAILTSGLSAIVGVILGHVALGQIRQTGEQGAGLAKVGLIVGYVFVGLLVLAVIAWIVFAVTFARSYHF